MFLHTPAFWANCTCVNPCSFRMRRRLLANISRLYIRVTHLPGHHIDGPYRACRHWLAGYPVKRHSLDRLPLLMSPPTGWALMGVYRRICGVADCLQVRPALWTCIDGHAILQSRRCSLRSSCSMYTVSLHSQRGHIHHRFLRYQFSPHTPQ